MTNSYDVDHGLSQCPPGPLEPVELAQKDGTLARTGNTARDQEMYAAGIRIGEENTKHNAAIRASMPDGWELVTRKTCYALMHDGAVIATLAGPESETNAAIIARMLAAPGVSTVEDAPAERSPTHGMTLGERIAHVGGRTNAQGDVEFGSPMAVNALIQHVLRDIDCTRQEDDGAYQARYRLPGGQWSSWGHVVCGVKGHEQELRYFQAERRPAPAAGDAQAKFDIEAAAQKMAECMDYPWAHMPEQGRKHMRESAQAVIDAALAAQRKGDA